MITGQTLFASTGALRIADGDIIHTVIDFLSYLKLKGMLMILVLTNLKAMLWYLLGYKYFRLLVTNLHHFNLTATSPEIHYHIIT